MMFVSVLRFYAKMKRLIPLLLDLIYDVWGDYKFKSLFVCMCVCLCVCACVCMCVCMCVCLSNFCLSHNNEFISKYDCLSAGCLHSLNASC